MEIIEYQFDILPGTLYNCVRHVVNALLDTLIDNALAQVVCTSGEQRIAMKGVFYGFLQCVCF